MKVILNFFVILWILIICSRAQEPVPDDLIVTPFREVDDEIANGFKNYLDLYTKYGRILPLVTDVCASTNAEDYCDLKSLIIELIAMHSNLQALWNHEDRRFVGNHDSKFNKDEYLESIENSLEIRTLTKKIEEVGDQCVEACKRTSDELISRYKQVAQLETNVAKSEYSFIRKKLRALHSKVRSLYSKSRDSLSDRMGFVVGSAVAAAKAKRANAAIRLAKEVFTFLNPLDWFGPDGKVDKAAIVGKVERLFSSEGLIEKSLKLFESHTQKERIKSLVKSMKELESTVYKVFGKLAENTKQLDQFHEILEQIENSEDEEIIQNSDNYIEIYKKYNPALTRQHLVKLLSALKQITQSACEAIKDSGANFLIRQFVRLDKAKALKLCYSIRIDLPVLDSYFAEIYDLQFELKDAFAAFLRGFVAKSRGYVFEETVSPDDLAYHSFVIGLIMDEISVQNAAQSFCNVLEYERGGVRPSVCKHLTFTQEQRKSLRVKARPNCFGGDSNNENCDYKGYAFLPTEPEPSYDSIHKHFINVTNLLHGNTEYFAIPNDEEWLKDHGWIREADAVDFSTAYVVERLELMIPGIECPGSGYRIQVSNDERVFLHIRQGDVSEDNGVPGYLINKVNFEFVWNTDPICADTRTFPIQHSNGSNDDVTICYNKEGTPRTLENSLYPGLFTTWEVSLHTHNCTFVDPDDYGYLITAYFELIDWRDDEDSDECWPNPCNHGAMCTDLEKDYRCDCPSNTTGKSCESGLAEWQEDECDAEHNTLLHRPTAMYIEAKRERAFSYFAVDGDLNTCAMSAETETPWFYVELPWYSQICRVVITGKLPTDEENSVEIVLSKQKPEGNIVTPLEDVLKATITETDSHYVAEFQAYSIVEGYQYLVVYELDTDYRSIFNICEIQAFSANGEYDGRYKGKECDYSRDLLDSMDDVQVSQISTMYGERMAEFAIDDDMLTFSRTNFYRNGTKPWFMITFPSAQEICGVKIIPPYVTVSANGLAKASVGFAYDPPVPDMPLNKSKFRPCGYQMTANPVIADAMTASCEELPIKGQHLVVISEQENVHLSICDIQVFGTK